MSKNDLVRAKELACNLEMGWRAWQRKKKITTIERFEPVVLPSPAFLAVAKRMIKAGASGIEKGFKEES